VKPNLNKALKSLTEGKLDEAKTNIDAAITDDKLKGDGKTWYYRGLIYAAIDTTSNEQYKALAPEAFNTALEAFKMADSMDTKKKGYVTALPTGGLEVKEVQLTNWANRYLNAGAAKYQEEDFQAAVENFDKVSRIVPNDTTAYFYGGFAANQAENYDKAIENFQQYIAKGGTSSDAYSLLINMYGGPKKDKEKALEVVREARKKFPNNADFPKVEIGTLIDLNRIDEAKSGLETAIKSEPNNKLLHFYLGYTNSTLGNVDAAKKNYEDALRVDPQYIDAQLYLAKLYYLDAAKIKKEMSNLGISAADKKKRFDLDKVLVEKLKVALPYFEKAEKIDPNNQEVLDNLYSIYGDLDMQEQVKRIDKRYKELGMEN
jgi:tetratricopeptide (TPR) repeat protein